MKLWGRVWVLVVVSVLVAAQWGEASNFLPVGAVQLTHLLPCRILFWSRNQSVLFRMSLKSSNDPTSSWHISQQLRQRRPSTKAISAFMVRCVQIRFPVHIATTFPTGGASRWPSTCWLRSIWCGFLWVVLMTCYAGVDHMCISAN